MKLSLTALSIIYCLVVTEAAKPKTPSHTNYAGDPEAFMDVPEIVEHWGYPIETRSVLTDDGYVLLMHRIPYGRNGLHRYDKAKPVVFLQHGLLCTSSVWVMNMPNQSPAFILADYGFDVWMGNNRGNTYSREHLKYDTTSSEYWHFSWTDMSNHDLPAMIDRVLNITGQESIYYVGHSQGTLTMFSKLSTDQKMNQKIKKFFAIAPVGTMAHVKGIFAWLGGSMFNNFKLFSMMFGDTEFLPNNIVTRVITQFICGIASKDPFCENFMFLLGGPDSNQMNKTRIGVYLAHNPAGTSTRNMMHYAQMVHSGKHTHYDYELPTANKRHYGKPYPPAYNLSAIAVPMYLYYSDADWVATSKDVEGYLLNILPKEYLKMSKKLDDFNHNDFLWGLRSPKEIFIPIADIIKKDYEEYLNSPETLEDSPKKAKVVDDFKVRNIVKLVSLHHVRIRRMNLHTRSSSYPNNQIFSCYIE